MDFKWEYLSKVLSEYLYSDFYDEETAIRKLKDEIAFSMPMITKKSVENRMERCTDFMNRKSFKDFLVQKKSDLSYLYGIIVNIIYDKDINFGKTLELNSGLFESLAYYDNNQELNIDLVSKYASKETLGNTAFNYYEGDVVYLGTIEDDKQNQLTQAFTLLLKAYYNEQNQDHTVENHKPIDAYNTIFNINPEDPNSILYSYLYAKNTNRFLISGYCTNLYDKSLDEKIETMKEISTILKESYGIEDEVTCDNDKGTVLRILTNL